MVFSMFKKETKNNNLITERKIKEQEDLIEYLTESNDDKEDKIRDLQEENNRLEQEKLSSDLKIAKKDNEIEEKDNQIEMLEKRIKYLENLVENYQNMPDLKNMIDNLSELTTPSIESLTKVLKDCNFDNFTKVEEKLTEMNYLLNELCHRGPRSYSL